MLAVLEEGLLTMLFDLKYIDSAIYHGFIQIADCTRRTGNPGKHFLGRRHGIGRLARAGKHKPVPGRAQLIREDIQFFFGKSSVQGRVIGHYIYSDRSAVRPGMEAHAEDRAQRTLGERLLADARVGHNLIPLGCSSDACINYAEQQTYKQDETAEIYSNCHDLYNSSVRHQAESRSPR
jgi:hypothetical protein